MSQISMMRIAVILGLFLPQLLLAQSTEQILEVGNSYYEKGDYLGASEVYKQAMEIDSSDAAVLYNYAKSLMQLMKMEEASRYFFKASLIDRGENYPDIYFLLAESYRGSGDYRKARRYYSKALTPYRSDRKSYWYKRIQQSKEANNWAMKQAESTNVLSSFGEKFNTDESEYAARIKDGQLYFSSLRADSIESKNVIKDQHYYSRIYTVDINQNGKSIELEVPIDLKDRHLANISLSKNSNTIYFSACDTNFSCEIWQARLVNNKLESAKALNRNINFPNYNNTQAEIIEKEGVEFLIFSSDRPKGFGGMDLWISEKKEFGFDEAKNLGSGINSPGEEITPFYKNGWLYFSSNWHYGLGGFDIFKSQGWIPEYTEPENLGSPINSAADDYYFSRSDGQAILSSNRNTVQNQSFCCNDLYFTPYDEELADSTIEKQKDTIIPDIVTLNKYLPLDLYFHNDVPDPNSKDSTTNENYYELAEEYLLLRDEYIEELSKSEAYVKDEELSIKIESFFENELIAGMEDLEFFTPLLLKALESGNQIDLTVKGFASSISGAEYNLNLTLRRIESLINYFKEYQNGAFLKYMNGEAENGGSLKFIKLPFGEFALSGDNLEDNKTLAVYSPQAASQRKIELIAVSKKNGEKKRMDNLEEYDPPKISFNSRKYDLGKVETNELSRAFIIKNEGGETLEIYNVMINCEDCANIQFPEKLEKGESSKIEVNIDTKNMKGEVILTLTVVSNALPHLDELNIQLSK